jgi:hypothetical protein
VSAGPDTIPFRQADSNGHYKSKQLPDNQADFMEMLGLPSAGFGDVTGPAGSVVGQVAIFDDATGKRLNTTSLSGLAKLTTGVLSSVPAPTGIVVGTTDAQTLTNKTLTNPVITGLTGLTKADVGLANVDNTSDATKNAAVATLTNKTIPNATITSPSGLVKADVGLGNVDNTSDAAKPVSTAQQTALNLKEDKANKGVNNGYASLDSSGKVPSTQLPSTGASVYQGTWNAATNTPTIPAAAAGNNGWYYNVNVAGTTNINGINSWAVGDQIISNGTVWQKIPNAQAVNSVNGQTGVVVLTKSDVGLANVDNTSDAAKPISTATQTALNAKQDTSAKGAVSGYASLDGSGKVPTAQLPAAALSSGDVVGPASSVAAEIASYADTTGKLLARITPPAGALVGTTASQTLTNKILTSPTINSAVMSTPTGITKADVGLGNVDNTSDATKNSASATLTNKTINGASNTLTVRLANDVSGNLPVTNLNGGTAASATTWWRGDGVWASPSGSGDVVGPAGSTDGNLAVFSGATGKLLKDTSGKLASDVVVGPSTSVTDELTLFSGTGGRTLKRCGLTGFVKAAASGAATAQTQMGAADIGTAAITGQTAKTSIAAADQFLMYDSVGVALKKVAGNLVQRFSRGYLVGLKVSNNATDTANDIDIAMGECRSDDDSEDMVLGTALTKRIDAAWVAGTNQGGLDTGTLADGNYHLFLIKNPTTGVVDALFSLSLASPTMPSGYTVKRRLLSIRRNLTDYSGLWKFKQLGDYFQSISPVAGNEASGIGGAPNMTYPRPILSVPMGFKVLVHISMRGINTAGTNTITVKDPDSTGPGSPLWCIGINNNSTAEFQVWCDTAAQMNFLTGGGTSGQNWYVTLLGYWDPRGKDV